MIRLYMHAVDYMLTYIACVTCFLISGLKKAMMQFLTNESKKKLQQSLGKSSIYCILEIFELSFN